MLRNYVVLGIRNIFKNKLISLVNIGGLTIALAFGLFAVVFAFNELTYDLFHVNAKRIYRIRERTGDQFTSRTSWQLGPAISSEFPDVAVVRVYKSRGSIAYGERAFRFQLSYVDPTFLDVFSFAMAMGNGSTALRDVRSIVITDKVARRLFADTNPVGKVVTLNEKEAYTVTGVLSRLPENSSIVFDCLLPSDAADESINSWANVRVRPLAREGTRSDAAGESLNSMLGMIPVATTFLLLPEYIQPRNIEDRFPKVVQRVWGRQGAATIILSLQPFNEVHFDQHTRGFERSTNPMYVYIFIAIALIAITISCVNFSALAIGRSLLRANEAGVRQLFGARRLQLVSQYLVEPVLLALIAMFIALGLIGTILPSLNSLVGTKISMYGQLSVKTSLYMLLLTVAIGILAGLYPALALSRLHPAAILYVRSKSVNPGFLMRLLLAIQSAMSMALLMVALAMSIQLDLLVNTNPGFRTDGVIVIETGQLPETSPGLVEVYKQRIASYPNVIGVARGQHPLSNKRKFKGFAIAEGRTVHGVETIPVDYDFLTTLKFTFLEGRDFSKSIFTDRNAVIINQALMKQFGWQSVTDKAFNWNGSGDVSIIGAVRDFHFRSFHQPVAPAFIFLYPGFCSKLFVVSTSNDDRHVFDTLRKEWNKIAPSQPFRAWFLEDDLKNQYKKDTKWLNAIQVPAILALGFACLGAFGMTSFSVARRTKEIGIRKVFGTPIPRLMARLTFDFLKIVILAAIIAAPIAYVVLREWLQNFVYRIDLIVPIIIGATLTFALVMLAVSCKTYRAATANPANTLRDE